MSDNEIDISRRKILAGLGTAGVAAAGAGLGTTAYLNDTESFDENNLTAGTLDLLLDYRVRYHGGPGRLSDIQGMGYPDAEPVTDEEGTYLLEEVPTNGDIPEGWGEYVSGADFCTDYYRDVLVNGDEIAPIHLQDVKPGDSGCLTTSLHLCGNPGYLWMNGGLVANDDNGLTEPEGADGDTSGGEGEGELAENIETTVWYDENCDCEFDAGGPGNEVDVMLVLDRSGSMGGSMSAMRDAAIGLVGELGSNVHVGLVSYADNDTLDQPLTASHTTVNDAISVLGSGGSTNIEGAVLTAQDELENGAGARAGADKIMVVMSDGVANVDDSPDANDDPTEEAQAAKDAGTEIYTVSFGSPDQATLEAMASDPVNAHFFEAANDEELIDTFSDIGQSIAGERIIFEGTLAELTGVLSNGNGIPLDGDRQSDYDEVVEGSPDDGVDEGRECFDPGETHCIGLHWELPAEVENVVQSDSVVFDVGFYGEQCRHNDGSGPTVEGPVPV